MRMLKRWRGRVGRAAQAAMGPALRGLAAARAPSQHSARPLRHLCSLTPHAAHRWSTLTVRKNKINSLIKCVRGYLAASRMPDVTAVRCDSATLLTMIVSMYE